MIRTHSFLFRSRPARRASPTFRLTRSVGTNLAVASAKAGLSFFLLSLIALASLAHAADSSSRAPAPKSDYVLQPSDLLRIEVFQEESLKREVRISQEYGISLPLIGQINLKGRTLREAQSLIRDLYNKDYLVNPQVTVTVIDYSKRFVNVIGQVNQAGVVEFPPEQGLTLLEAITRAGGFNRLANKKTVTLTRTVDGKTDKSTVNTDDIVAGVIPDIPLTKDDVINVPEKLL
ncbi:MAG: hypothetical protein RL324_2233 [Verrucomicrobiota bacterium]|jgi:polysaccharide export outer membrane protein